MDLEKLQRENQAKLGLLLQRATSRKLFGVAQSFSEKKRRHAPRCLPPVKDKSVAKPPSVKLRLETKRDRITKITNLTILPKLVGAGQDGENITGSLEAHMGGFQYTTSRPNFCVDFWYKSIQSAFYQVGDDRTPPLLHFKLHHYIMVGTEKTKQIQFHLMPKTFPSDLKKTEKNDRNEELVEFVRNVVFKWRASIVFEEVEKMHEFHGVFPSKASGAFALTFSSLVGLLEEPFVVVRLREIELVYLAQVSPDEIDMTLVYEDYDREVLQINSIPLKSVARIKAYLGLRKVKYFENNEKQNWKLIMEEMAISPQDNGWEILNPEGSDGYETTHSSFVSVKDGDEYD
ncbi:hypothetical protein MKX03_037581 [Papaver bracteatum]|nr:hypothetical protein MKX03_037581 [Papaver bracteatum]